MARVKREFILNKENIKDPRVKRFLPELTKENIKELEEVALLMMDGTDIILSYLIEDYTKKLATLETTQEKLNYLLLLKCEAEDIEFSTWQKNQLRDNKLNLIAPPEKKIITIPFSQYRNNDALYQWLEMKIEGLKESSKTETIRDFEEEEIPKTDKQKVAWLISIGVIDFIKTTHKVNSHSVIGKILGIGTGIKSNTIKVYLDRFYDKKLGSYDVSEFESYLTIKKTKYELK
jgi:hypothetical protein